jgi:hypothetical protein
MYVCMYKPIWTYIYSHTQMKRTRPRHVDGDVRKLHARIGAAGVVDPLGGVARLEGDELCVCVCVVLFLV